MIATRNLILDTIVKYTTKNELNIKMASLRVNSEIENLTLGACLMEVILPLMSLIYDKDEDKLDRECLSFLSDEMIGDIHTIVKTMTNKGSHKDQLPEYLRVDKITTVEQVEKIVKRCKDMKDFIATELAKDISLQNSVGGQLGKMFADNIRRNNTEALEAMMSELSDADLGDGELILLYNIKGANDPMNAMLVRAGFDAVLTIFSSVVEKALEESGKDDGTDRDTIASVMLTKLVALIATENNVNVDFDMIKKVTRLTKKRAEKDGIISNNK